jgi:adenylate kinase
MGRADDQDREYAEHLLEALADPVQSPMFSIDTQTIVDTPGQYIMAEGKPVAVVLTPRIRVLLEEALGALIANGEPADEDDEDEPRANRGRFEAR